MTGVEQHPLQPFLPHNARMLMLGSFPPPRKRWSMDFYYPNWNNDMWRITGLLFFGDKDHFADTAGKCFRKDVLVSFLTGKGIALFDTASAVRRLQGNASDKYLEVVTPTDIPSLLTQIPQCQAIVTTGEKSTATLCERYGVPRPDVGGFTLLPWNEGQMRLYRMPSSSRAYPLAIEKKAAVYRTMYQELQLL